MQEHRAFEVDQLKVCVYPDRDAMGRAAGSDVATAIAGRLEAYGHASVMFAAAPSQDEVLRRLRSFEGIDWSRVTAYHMDEYVGLPATAPQSFRTYLRDTLFDVLPFGTVNLIHAETADPEVEAVRYEELLKNDPPNIVVMGIGENGHIAFNDPPNARFDDERWVRVVALSEASRIQQVHDGCFVHVEEVPTHALTVTIPPLIRARERYCVVPGETKAAAVRTTLHEAVSPTCPASILRTVSGSVLYLDSAAATAL